MDSDRTLTQKIVLWALLVMAVVFTVANIILKFLPGVAFEDTLLKVTQNGEQTVYTGRKHQSDITIVTYPEETGHAVKLTIGDSIDHVYRVEYPGGTIKGEHGGEYDRITISRVRNGDVTKMIFDGGYKPGNFAFCKPDGTVDLGLGSGNISCNNLGRKKDVCGYIHEETLLNGDSLLQKRHGNQAEDFAVLRNYIVSIYIYQ